MKQKLPLGTALTLCSLVFFLTGCAAIGDLMKTSFWAGAIFVIVIIFLIIFIITRLGRKK